MSRPMMKRKPLILPVLLCLAVLLSASVSAAGQTCTLEELDAEIVLPEGDFYVFRRGMDPDDPVLEAAGLTAGQAEALLEEGGLYLEMIRPDASYELTVRMQTGEDYALIFDYSLLNQDLRETLCREGKKELEKQGLTIQQIEWYESGSVLYLYLEGTQDTAEAGSSQWLYQYQTIHNGKMISLNAVSPYLDEPVPQAQEQLKALADSLRFTYDAPVPQEALDFHADRLGGIDWLAAVRSGAIGGIAAAVTAAAVTVFRRRRKGD